MRARLGDSKDLVSHGNVTLGEAWARQAFARVSNEPALTPESLLHALCIDSPDVLRARCPADHEAQCWNTESEAFSAETKTLKAVARDLDKLEALGVKVTRAEVAIVCTERINEAASRGVSRFHVDLHTMERLVLSARAATNEPVYAICGKVGGMGSYGDQFGPLSSHLHAVVEQGKARSEYRFPNVGSVAFVRDADASHLIVGMASLVGKWAREVLMARIVRHYRKHVDDLPQASGYHDPITAQFVHATRLVRKKTKLPSDCFERRAIGDAATSKKRPTAPPASS
ncbi:MAG: hypothetical protein ACRELY_02355 [Polyangiaceae bacterium]